MSLPFRSVDSWSRAAGSYSQASSKVGSPGHQGRARLKGGAEIPADSWETRDTGRSPTMCSPGDMFVPLSAYAEK
jgi:hypothetical protein